MTKASLLAVFLLVSVSVPAHALTWACTCRDKDGNDVGGVEVTTSPNASWDDAVKKANRQCKKDYSNSVGGANCDSSD